MADGVDLPASGVKAATDDRTIGGVAQHVQRIVQIGSTIGAGAQVTISSTSAAIVAARDTRSGVLIVNRQSVSVFINVGGTATTADFELAPGDAIVLPTTVAINGITSAAYTAVGTAKVHYIELYD